MAQDEQRVVFQGLVGQQLLIATLLDGRHQREQTADGLREIVLRAIALVDFFAFGHPLERLPVGTDEGVRRQVFKLE